MNLPRILIVSRGVWDDTGLSSTLSNIFQNYDSAKLSQIYIETKKPNTSLCHSFFQISEFSLIKKLYKWGTKTGRRVDASYVENQDVARKEADTMQYVRGHRSFAYTILREFLWHFNGWKTQELRSFIADEKPDVIWLTGSPLILMNRLSQYVAKQAGKPYCIYEMDDVYSYKNCGKNPFKYIYRFFLRKRVRSLVKGASQVFVISPKMKQEYDSLFGVESIVLTKGIDYEHQAFVPYTPSKPVNMVYTGQLLYGRLSSIAAVAKAIDAVNVTERKIVLKVYSGTPVPEVVKRELSSSGNVSFLQPVPYSQVNEIIRQNDVVLFAESLEKAYRNLARVSFSTKLTDYFAGGKCIFAIGPKGISPIVYLEENDAAIVVSDGQGLQEKLKFLLSPGVIEEYARKSYQCGERNHDKRQIDQMLFSRLISIANKNESPSTC